MRAAPRSAVRPRRVARGAAAALALATAVAAGGCQSAPERAATRFLNRYFVEADQEAALEYTTGLAAARLRREIDDTREARAVGGVTTDGRRVFYELVRRADASPERIDLVYRLEIASGGSSYFHDVGLSLERVGDDWRVANFAELPDEGSALSPPAAPAPRAPPGSGTAPSPPVAPAPRAPPASSTPVTAPPAATSAAP
ncbi:MAG TPA: hypothetical protein VG389_13810 [Myxococcota bacterium]|jgi:hypothetical protein|nr:hypothetical protein [Myxococcota bacterium]